MTEPLQLTPAEMAADSIISLENWARSRMQSRQTKAGARAEPPSRDRVRRALRLLMPCRLQILKLS